MTPNIKTISLVREFTENYAGSSLPPVFAKLYSQHVRLGSGQPGLHDWSDDEALHRLDDAVKLLEAGFLERDAGISNWYAAAQRAGELLEWLSHPQLNQRNLPTRLLAAAAYQIAGYPARSSGVLRNRIIRGTEGNTESAILDALLKADFPGLLELLTKFWAEKIITDPKINISWSNSEETSNAFHQWIVAETASSLGILCSEMRWGNEPRLSIALEKLQTVTKLLLHDYDPYSWLLARLCTEVAQIFIDSSLRRHTDALLSSVSSTGRTALDRYIRQNYLSQKSIAWPSQIRGIERLVREESFALCTPTGSGKTTVAELAILQSLFSRSGHFADELIQAGLSAPIVMYLVPSRALASEVEAKLSRVLKRLKEEPIIIVTGLYGGNDWGPTDAWLTSKDRTILICTYEKAEALLRFLGPLFVRRVSLIVIDEAHTVQYDGNFQALRNGESRSLRLETLGMRLLTYINHVQGRVIALSAVAGAAEAALAKWVTGVTEAEPEISSYRSTRQLIGRLEILPHGRMQIRYDLLDGASLQFSERTGENTPYVPNPFPTCPVTKDWDAEGPEKRLRPFLLWAATHLCSFDQAGQQRAVLISVTQGIEGYAADFLKLLNSQWAEKIPLFFKAPVEADKATTWNDCLRSCADYFGIESLEYQLLQKGIAVHHGKMPGLMARLLIRIIEDRIIHLVLATSTLTEGVNLPFETVLVPSLRRGQGDLSLREFSNLVGRAGRPGFGTEGRTLVLLESESLARTRYKDAWKSTNIRKRYFQFIEGLRQQNHTIDGNYDAQSPLAELLTKLEEQWKRLNSKGDFADWLEKTAPLSEAIVIKDEDEAVAIDTLDSLDGLLISAIVEIEQIANQELSLDELEERLSQVWKRTYAHYASSQESRLEDMFIRRGTALKSTIYPNKDLRRQLYRTSLSPRAGNQLLLLYPNIKAYLSTGDQYVRWSTDAKFNYIRGIVERIGTLPKFRYSEKAGRSKVEWVEVLRWWLSPSSVEKKPRKEQISAWHNYVSQNFAYRFNWGLGNILALVIDESHEGELRETKLEDWPLTGLPWIVFWVKELLVWGTLEPVAAYLLSQGLEITRPEAEQTAKRYYEEQLESMNPNDVLNATTIRDWTMAQLEAKRIPNTSVAPPWLSVKLLRNFTRTSNQFWRVVPVEVGKEIYWNDPGGFALAVCERPEDWDASYLARYDFTLDSSRGLVVALHYL
jgi:hypothetical protein